MRRQFASAALLNLLLVAGASAQTAPHRAPPPTTPATDCPMHDPAGSHVMQPGTMPMRQEHPMPGAMEHCRAMHDSAEHRQRHQMMHHPGKPPVSQKQEKDQ